MNAAMLRALQELSDDRNPDLQETQPREGELSAPTSPTMSLGHGDDFVFCFSCGAEYDKHLFPIKCPICGVAGLEEVDDETQEMMG